MESATLIDRLLAGHELNAAEIEAAMTAMLSSTWSPVQSAAFLTALRAKGETPAELAAAATDLVNQCVPVVITNPARVLDTAGTGGDGQATFNISTAAAFVAAACGVPVAKHGNRALSGKCGSSDLLAGIGVDLDLAPAQLAAIHAQVGICFMFAPAHHPALKAVAAVRKELGIRTIFNLLGPLANPAGAGLRLAGVFAPQWLVPYAQALHAGGVQRAVVVHAAGLDEFSVAAPSHYAVLTADGRVSEHTITPPEAGVGTHAVAELRVNSTAAAVAMFNAVIDGEPGGPLEACIINAGAALFAAGVADSITAGAATARGALTTGAVRAKVTEFVAASQATSAR